MPAPASNALLDGVSTVTRGMHSGIAPRLLPANQLAFAINVTCRNGLPRTRPVFRRVPLTYPDATTEARAKRALFQCGGFYQAYGQGESCLVASIGGRLFRYLVGTTNAVQDISLVETTLTLVNMGAGFVVPAVGSLVTVTVDSTASMVAGQQVTILGRNYLVDSIGGATSVVLMNGDAVAGATVPDDTPLIKPADLNSATNPDAWMWQAEDFLIVNNGQRYPLFFDGAGVRRSAGPGGQELPAGCMGCYVQGRNWMVLPTAGGQKPSQTFMASDLVYSHGYAGPYGGREACLKTEENNLLSGGGAFSVPVSAGAVTAMAAVAVQDTSLGQGSLNVMTRSAVFSVQVPLDRTEWAATQYPLMTVGLPNYGAVGARAVVAVNGDLWYRSQDGVRSYQIARRDMGTWVNTPLSVEVERVLSFDAPGLLERVSAVLFDNRWLVTCSPWSVRGRGTAHRGLVALDFNNISNLTQRSDPCYDGLWTGMQVLQVVKGTFNGVERAFAWALDCDADIVLYEILADGRGVFDFDGTDDVGVESVIETKAMGWADGGNRLKKLLCADLYLDKLSGPGAGTVTFDFKYRSDEDPFWQAWHAFSLCAPSRDCSTANCPSFYDVREQYRTYLRLPDPADTCSAITHRMKRTGYEFQVRMAWTGYAQLNRLHVWAALIGDSVVTACPTSQSCTLVPCETVEEGGVPGVEAANELLGIVFEDTSIWVTTEGGVVVRMEGQPQFGVPGVSGGGGSGGGGSTPPVTPPMPALPSWPAPVTPLCAGSMTWGPCTAQDTITPFETKDVAIPPAAGTSPIDYIYAWSATPSQCLAAWAAQTWAQFLASGTAFSQARLVWASTSLTGWSAIQVFPSLTGPFNEVVLLNTTIIVEYCT